MTHQNLRPCGHCGGEAKAEISKVKNSKYVCVIACTRCQRHKMEWKQPLEERYVDKDFLHFEASALWNNNAAEDMKLYCGRWIPFRKHIEDYKEKIIEYSKEGMNEESIAQEIGVPTKYIFEFLYKKEKKS